MKKTYFISALIAGAVVVGLSEPREVIIPNEKNTAVAAAKDDQTSRLVRTKEYVTREVKREWMNVKRKFEGTGQDDSPERRFEGTRRGAEKGMLQGSERMSPHIQRDQTSPMPSASEYLKGIASVLSIPVLKDDTPGDIAFKIKQCIGNAERYRGNVLSDESFEKAKSVIRISADAETFSEYHKFIKKIAGKKVIVIEQTQKP